MEDKLLLTTKECVEYIGIGETTLRNLAKTYDDIPHIFIGTKLYFIKSELNKWLVDHQGEILK
jgi:excisionase